jgi:hypothetical protein
MFAGENKMNAKSMKTKQIPCQKVEKKYDKIINIILYIKHLNNHTKACTLLYIGLLYLFFRPGYQ